MNKTNKSINRTLSLIIVVLVIVLSFGISFGAIKLTSSSNTSKALENNLKVAETAVSDFQMNSSRNAYFSSNELFSKADLIASMYTDQTSDETLETFAKDLSLNSIIITDDKGQIVSSFPSEQKGSNIKDNPETAMFMKVIKGVMFKGQSEPTMIDETTASIYSSVKRIDSQGCVIINSNVNNYDAITGGSISNDCKDNTIIAKGDEIVSSSFDKLDKTTLKDLGITEENLKNGNFCLSVNNTNYNFTSKTVGEYNVICGVESPSDMFLILVILVVDLILLIIAVAFILINNKLVSFAKQFFDIKFWKFILVGILNTLIGNGLMFVFFNFTPLHDFNLGFINGYWISSAVGYIIGSVVSYFLNKHFTFQNKEKGFKPAMKFAINIAICYLLAYGIAQPLVTMLLSGQSNDIQTNIAMLTGMCLFVVFNYIGQRFFAFKEKSTDETTDSKKPKK